MVSASGIEELPKLMKIGNQIRSLNLVIPANSNAQNHINRFLPDKKLRLALSIPSTIPG